MRTMCKDRRFYRHLWIRYVVLEIKWCMYSRDELFLRSLECYFWIYFPRCFATREINTKITLSWPLKQFVTRVHTLFSINTPYSLVSRDPIATHFVSTLQWRQNERKCVSNHRRLDYLLNLLFKSRSENIIAPRHWPLWDWWQMYFSCFDTSIFHDNANNLLCCGIS